MFDELEDQVRRSQKLFDATELNEKLRQHRLQLKRIDALKPQLWKLGQLAGLTFSDAVSWAGLLVERARELAKPN
jgi:hypothetical protein